MGAPRLFVGVTAGNLDSMLNKLTAQKKNRVARTSTRPGGRTGCRPDRATIVYAHRCREAFPGRADRARRHRGLAAPHRALRLLVATRCAARSCSTPRPICSSSAWASGRCGRSPTGCAAASPSREIRDVRGTAFLVNDAEMERARGRPGAHAWPTGKTVVLPSYEEVARRQGARSRGCRAAFQLETNPGNARPAAPARTASEARLLQPAGARRSTTRGRWTSSTICRSARVPHPIVRASAIPAFETVKHSIVLDARLLRRLHLLLHHRARGARHPEPLGRERAARGARAARAWTTSAATITDLGGPTANMYKMALQGRGDRVEVPAPVLRAPGRLREPRHRSRPAHRPA